MMANVQSFQSLKILLFLLVPILIIIGPKISWSHYNVCPSSAISPSTSNPAMSWTQKQFTLQAKSRGSYLVTDQVLQAVPEIRDYKIGLLNLFIQHTSCALSLNENCEKKPVRDAKGLKR